MKKLLIMFLILIISAPAYSITHFEAGRKSYYAKDYAKAKSYFYKETKKNPKNYEAYYFLGLTYLNLNDKEKAKIALKKTTKLAPKSSLAYTASKKELLKLTDIETYKKVQEKQEKLKENEDLKNNYYNYMKKTHKGTIIKEFPVDVYITPYEHKSWIKQAFNKWEYATNNFVTFNFVDIPEKDKIIFIDTSEKAKIIVTTTNKPFPAGQNGLLLGLAEYTTTKDNYLKLGKITILKQNPNKKIPINKNQFVNVLSHEIGHLLGLGHSSSCKDIMGTNCSFLQINTQRISKRDVNTLKIIYKKR